MAETPETRLELALRRALAEEASMFPFTLDRAGILGRRQAASRPRARLLLAAATLVAAGLVVALALPVLRPPARPAAEPAELASLPSVERLLEAQPLASEMGRAEGRPAEAEATITLAEGMRPALPLVVVGTCTGAPLDVELQRESGTSKLGSIECTGGTSFLGIPPIRTADAGPGTVGIGVRVPAGTAWRAVVVAGETGPIVDAVTSAQPGLPSFSEIAGVTPRGGRELVRVSGATGDAPATIRAPFEPGTLGIDIALACTSGMVELWLARGPTIADEEGAVPFTCGGGAQYLSLAPGPMFGSIREIHVRTPPNVRWMLVVGSPSPGAS